MPDAQDSLTDGDLQSEIELVGELVVAATSSEGPLPQDEIDRLLGVEAGDEVETIDEVESTVEAKVTLTTKATDEVQTADKVEAADEVEAAENVEGARAQNPEAES